MQIIVVFDDHAGAKLGGGDSHCWVSLLKLLRLRRRKAGRPHFPPDTGFQLFILHGLELIWEQHPNCYPEKRRKKPANPGRTARIRQSDFKTESSLKGIFMRTGNYEASDHGSAAGTAVTFLLIGLGAGALLGMLLAPKAGKQMRKDLRRKFDSARETVDEWTDDAREFAEEAMERGADIADQVREKVAPLTKAMRR
jgi:hypothetical protein